MLQIPDTISSCRVPPVNLGIPSGSRVVVAMSGGVDSTVAAALCKLSGYDVVGITMQLYDHGAATKRKGACCAGQDIHDARKAADALDFPHYVLNYEDRFREAVVEDFADTYLAGSTPNPCIRCNERVKFEDLLKTAIELDAGVMVTGHYVRHVATPDGPQLHRARDLSKDQSYFLFSMSAGQLERLRFPLGDMPKEKVRSIAEALGLENAAKPDSQDICFVPQGSYTSLVSRLRPGSADPGDIVHIDGTVLGRHPGIVHYTVGQRRGLGLSTGDPLYVVCLDADRKRVIVGPRDALLVKRIRLSNASWIGTLPEPVRPGRQTGIAVKIRSAHQPVPALLDTKGSPEHDWSVTFGDPHEGVSPGQACVFYSPEEGHERVLGGGWISGTDCGYGTGM